MAARSDPPQNGDLGSPEDEITLSDEEWPVAEQYRVDPQPPRGAPDDEGTIVLQQDAPAAPVDDPRVRRFPPNLGPGLLLTLIAVLLIPAGIWLAAALRDDSEASATTDTTETVGSTTQPTTSTTSTTQTTAPEAKTVPAVASSTLAEARSRLEQAGLRVRFRRVDSDKAPGEVLEQLPASGSSIQPNGIVVLVVSGGPERVAVPRVLGLNVDEATDLIRDAGLRPETSSVQSRSPKGTVVNQVPNAGEEVGPKTVVRLEIAMPPPVPTVAVPDLIGLESSEARSRLRELGLRVTQKPIESSRPRGTVVRQSPGAGVRVREGRTVTLTVSTGPAKVEVPDVVGLDEQAARQELEAVGFAVTVVDEPTDDIDEDGVVLAQNPAGGSSRPEGSTVTITVARL